MYMRILEENHGLPDNCEPIFCNTGKEHNATLDFVHAIEEHTGVPITWLEYAYNANGKGTKKDPKHCHKVVSYDTCSRIDDDSMSPFETMIRATNFVPNVVKRKCTSELKVRTIERYCTRHLNRHMNKVSPVLGIRYDEPRRWKKALYKLCRSEYPLVHAKITATDVRTYWNKQSFDLSLSPDKTNCILCFMKGKDTITSLIREDMQAADWWIQMEEYDKASTHSPNSSLRAFSPRWTYRQVRDEAVRSPEQQLNLDGGRSAVDCFCGD